MRVNRKLIKSPDAPIKKHSNWLQQGISQVPAVPTATVQQLSAYTPTPKPCIPLVILPEMVNVPWQLRPNVGGGRGIEVPAIQRKFQGITGKKIADFGCLEASEVTTSKYGISTDNEFFSFDNEDIKAPNYFKRDFMTDGIYEENSFDYGICVSVIEHVGLNVYRNTLNDNGDILALKNIIKTIKPGGILYVTIPVAEKFYMPLYWIRAYTVKQIESWGKVLGVDISMDTYQFIGDSWYSCPKEKIIGSYHYTGSYDIVTAAIIEMRKK